jgi:hypothetical protein
LTDVGNIPADVLFTPVAIELLDSNELFFKDEDMLIDAWRLSAGVKDLRF